MITSFLSLLGIMTVAYFLFCVVYAVMEVRVQMRMDEIVKTLDENDIDWSLIPNDFNYFSISSDGFRMFTNTKPERNECNSGVLFSFKIGSVTKASCYGWNGDPVKLPLVIKRNQKEQ